MNKNGLLHNKKKTTFILFSFILLFSFLIPENSLIPVKGATKNDWNPNSFWAHPWGASVTHKGVDVFAKNGTDVLSSTHAILIWSGRVQRGGNVVLTLGPKWKLHYYAHLQEITLPRKTFFYKGEKIGSVGSSGNAKGKPAHLHYSVATLIPYFWKADSSPQGYKKMFYLHPLKN